MASRCRASTASPWPTAKAPQVVTVYVEREGDGMITIAKDAFSRWDNLRMTNPPEKQAEMRKNFVAAMKFQGITVVP